MRNSQEYTCVGVSFLTKLYAFSLQFYLKRTCGTNVFLWIKNTCRTENPQTIASTNSKITDWSLSWKLYFTVKCNRIVKKPFGRCYFALLKMVLIVYSTLILIFLTQLVDTIDLKFRAEQSCFVWNIFLSHLKIINFGAPLIFTWGTFASFIFVHLTNT